MSGVPPTGGAVEQLSANELRKLIQACEGFEQDWNPRPSLQDRIPNLEEPLRAAWFEELLSIEIKNRRQRGESPTIQEYLAQFPEYQSIIESLLATPFIPLTPTLTPTMEIPGYQILKQLGQGGMGIVYQALQISSNRLIALKFITHNLGENPEIRKRFKQEAEITVKWKHPHFVETLDFGEHQGQLFYAMEWIDGGDLKQRLHDHPISVPQAVEWCETLARAIHWAHLRGIIHRDLKPTNILIRTNGEPCITDFGLAKLLDRDDGPSLPDQILGSFPYLAPEQAQGQSKRIGPQTDVYALGCLLYRMLTGHPPFVGSDLNTLQKILKHAPTPPRQFKPDLPPDLESICLKCLAKKPKHRYPTAAALADDLQKFRDCGSIRIHRSHGLRRFMALLFPLAHKSL